MSLSVSSGLFQHILLNGFKQFAGLCLQLVQANNCLFVGISAHQNGLILLHILRTDLHTQRNTSHLAVCKLPAGALVRIIYLYSIAGLHQPVSQLKRLV